MRIPVDTDILARTAARSWEASQASAATAARRLATGERVSSAIDDAAGLAIAERLRAQYEGLYQASRNAQEGVNFLQIAEGALSHTGDLLQRIRVLALQSANGTFEDRQRSLLQKVVDRTLDEIDAVAHGARYNGAALLDGSRTQWTLQVGADAGDTFTVRLDAATADALGLDGTMDERAVTEMRFAQAALDLGPLSIETREKAVTAIEILDRALAYVLAERAEHGASVNRLDFMIRTLGVTAENIDAAHSRIIDADIPAETARLLRSQIAGEASATMMAQAQRAQALVLELLRPLATPKTEPVRTVSAAMQEAGGSGRSSGAPAPATASSGAGSSSAAAPVTVGPWTGSAASAPAPVAPPAPSRTAPSSWSTGPERRTGLGVA